jgi:aspartyl-tRNA(Asn)/glutamyl-tRNA(Gln) amidotransferase subunit C
VEYHFHVPLFSRDDVLHFAALSRLELSDDEVDRFSHQLGDILAFARQIDSVDTSAAVDAGSAPDTAPASSRDDVPGPSLDREQTLAAAPSADRAHGLFKVPRVLNG